MNWKTEAAAAIVPTATAAVAPALSHLPLDNQLADQLATKIKSLALPGRDLDFAKSLLQGFTKWGSFTAKQRPHVERLVGVSAAPVNPLSMADADTAKALQAALDAGLIRSGDVSFAQSLLAGFGRYGSFSDKQRPYARKFAETAGEARHEAQAPVATPVPAPKPIGLQLPNLAALVNLDKFARFTVGKLQLSLKNDGSCVWVKWDGAIVGVIGQPGAEYRTSRRYVFAAATHAEAEAELVRIEADPMAAAKANGLLTGRCSCCGRPLTDPNSIAIGIGPICAEKGWG